MKITPIKVKIIPQWNYYDCYKCSKRHWSADKNPLLNYGEFNYCRTCHDEVRNMYESKTSHYLHTTIKFHDIVIRLLLAAVVVLVSLLIVKNVTI